MFINKFHFRQFCGLTTKSVYVFCTGLTTNSDYIRIQHYVTFSQPRQFAYCAVRVVSLNIIRLQRAEIHFYITFPPSSADVTKSGSLNLPEPSGPHRPVMGMLCLFYVTFPSQLGAYKFSECTFASCNILTSCATPTCPSHRRHVEGCKRHSFKAYNFFHPTENIVSTMKPMWCTFYSVY
jgi:hypothetical protein